MSDNGDRKCEKGKTNTKKFENSRRTLLVRVTEEQKNQEGRKKRIGCIDDAYKCTMEIFLRIEELYSKENDMKNQKQVIEDLETISDQYYEAVDRATSH